MRAAAPIDAAAGAPPTCDFRIRRRAAGIAALYIRPRFAR
jgi:hypothetical protein